MSSFARLETKKIRPTKIANNDDLTKKPESSQNERKSIAVKPKQTNFVAIPLQDVAKKPNNSTSLRNILATTPTSASV